MTPSTVTTLIDNAAKRFATFPNAALDAELLFRGISGLSRADLLTRGDEAVSADVASRFESAVSRRERHEPVQYILGTAAFWRDEFIVTPAVLIPRPETEVLVEAVVARVRDSVAPAILDIGTGSGCIALSLLRELAASSAVAVDLSRDALAVADANARNLGLDSRVVFQTSRWFDGLAPTETFDVIVSNPPYVAVSDKPTLPRDVREFEPALALFAEADDDLSSYRAICAGLEHRLRSRGLVAFEVGMGQANDVAELLRAGALEGIEILNDLAGIPRVVLARRP